MKKNTKKLVSEFSSEFEKESNTSFFAHVIAGSCAGIMEHTCMFPVDVIKTRLMAGKSEFGFCYTFCRTARCNTKCLFRGMHIAVLGSIPSHAALFSTYELLKRYSPKQNSLFVALSGVGATMMHDLFANFFGVIKTRIMLRIPESTGGHGVGKGFRHHKAGGLKLFRSVMAKEGLRAFFVSYPISLAMNIPFVVGYFTTYELLKSYIGNTQAGVLVAGGVAGGVAGWLSNPFDVIRIRMQNQSDKGMMTTARYVFQKYGLRGFLKGANARAVYYIPSGTITWFTYENVKRLLSS